MKHDVSEMQLFAAELRKELSCPVDGCKVEVDVVTDGMTPKVTVKSSPANSEQTTLYCMNEIAEYCNANDLMNYISVEYLQSGTAIPVIYIF